MEGAVRVRAPGVVAPRPAMVWMVAVGVDLADALVAGVGEGDEAGG